jgi:hypothetical protein
MDPLSLTAGIIAVVTAALQSTRVIKDVLGGIKDGPAHIHELTNLMDDLRGLLKQLRDLGNRTRGGAFDELKALTSRCADDLQVFEAKISKLRNIPGDKRWAKVRKRLKAVIREEDFLSMAKNMDRYINVFSAQLGVMGM